MGRLSAPCCGWMEPGRHELCVGGVCSLEDKYPCAADRDGTACTVVSIQVLLQAAWRASPHDPLQTSAGGYLGRL